MKTLTLLLALSAFAASAQTIRIADNNANRPAGANIYATLQAAINAAAPDDIVYITPSTTSYGDATVGKRITIRGVGFGIPEITPRSSTLGILTIVNSQDGVNSVSGLTLTSFSFNTINFAAGTGGSTFDNITAENVTGGSFNHTACFGIPTNNLILRRSNVFQISLGHCAGIGGILIQSNVITGGIDVRNSLSVVVSNNLFCQPTFAGSVFNTNASSPNIRIEHNIFSGTTTTVFQNVTSAIITNNIFYGTLPNGSGAPFHSNTFSNNLVLSAFTFPPTALGGPANSGVNNIPGVGPLFTNAPVSNSYNATFNYTLQAGSVCIGAATTGENIGPSGGLYPWTGNLTLKPSAIPVITEFGNSGVVPQNQPLKANIKVKSN